MSIEDNLLSLAFKLGGTVFSDAIPRDKAEEIVDSVLATASEVMPDFIDVEGVSIPLNIASDLVFPFVKMALMELFAALQPPEVNVKVDKNAKITWEIE